MPCPTYPAIRLALAGEKGIGERIAAAAPDAIHIATEGPLGLAARRWCLKRKRPFTTAYHTQFPEYLAQRTGAPAEWFWRYIRWFHAPAHAVLAATPTVARTLTAHGLPHSRRCRQHGLRSEEHTAELQSLMRTSYAVFCLKNNKNRKPRNTQ